MSKFKTHSITKTNELFYAGAFVVTNKLGVKIDKVAGRKEKGKPGKGKVAAKRMLRLWVCA